MLDHLDILKDQVRDISVKCIWLSGIAIAILIATILFKTYVMDSGGDPDFKKIISAFLKVILLMVYIEVVGVSLRILDYSVDYLVNFEELTRREASLGKERSEQLRDKALDDGQYLLSIWRDFKNDVIVSNPNMKEDTAYVRAGISFAQITIGSFLFISGPIVILLSILLGDKLLKSWIMMFTGVVLWRLAMGVLLIVEISLMPTTGGFGIFVLNICYLLIPTLTAVFIGRSLSTEIVAKVSQVVTAIATSVVALSATVGSRIPFKRK